SLKRGGLRRRLRPAPGAGACLMATTLPDQPEARTGDGPVLEVRNLTVEFPTDEGSGHPPRGVSSDLPPRQVLGIVGESGSGKSVTSLAIMGLLPRSARIRGEVNYRGQNLVKLSDKDQSKIRGKH